jgi:hypothetical protein
MNICGLEILRASAPNRPRIGERLTDTYTKEEVAEFKRADEELRAILPKLTKPARTPRKLRTASALVNPFTAARRPTLESARA